MLSGLRSGAAAGKILIPSVRLRWSDATPLPGDGQATASPSGTWPGRWMQERVVAVRRPRTADRLSCCDGEQAQPPPVIVAPAGVAQPGLLQHPLRCRVFRMGQPDDAREPELIEPIVHHRARPLGRVASTPD